MGSSSAGTARVFGNGTVRAERRALVLVPELEIRTVKIVEALAAMGFVSDLLAERHSYNTFDARLAQAGVSPLTVSLSWIPTQLARNPLRSFRMRRAQSRLVRGEYSLVYARDVFLGDVALRMTRRSRAEYRPAVVVDIADDYMAVLAQASRVKQFYGRIVRAHELERRVLLSADVLLFVAGVALETHGQRHGLSLKNNAVVVPNVPNEPLGTCAPPALPSRRGELLYVGMMDRGIRDFETVFESDRYLKRPVSLDCFVFNSQSNPYVTELRRRSLGCDKLKVRFLEAVRNENYAEVLDEYRVGIIPHCRNPVTDFTVPNKLYDYVDRGLEIVASDNPAIVSEVARMGAGRLYRGGDARSFAHVVTAALDSASGATVPCRWPRDDAHYFGAHFVSAATALFGGQA